MAFNSHVAYYNEDEINAIYTEQISSNVEIEKTETTAVTTRILGILGTLGGEIGGESVEERMEQVADEDTKKAVEVTQNLVNSADVIPPFEDIQSTDSEYYQYSGEVDVYLDFESDMTRLEGTAGDFDFVAHASRDNWTGSSYLAGAGPKHPQTMNIDGIAYPISSTTDSEGRYNVKFIIIYPGNPTFVE